jgi:hypothetical protein
MQERRHWQHIRLHLSIPVPLARVKDLGCFALLLNEIFVGTKDKNGPFYEY